MALFQSNSCASFTWDNQECCHGVLLKHKSEHYHILRTWSGVRTGHQTRAQLLESGYAALAVDEDTTVLVGGNSLKACIVDVKMPKMPAPQLRQALAFELTKHTPLALDELQWNYRIVRKIPGAELNLIRMVYLPRPEWESWISAASGIDKGVDMIVPAAAVCDPILTGRDICFANHDEESSYILKSQSNGEREITSISPAVLQTTLFGTGDTPLKLDHLNLEQLGTFETTKQQGFAAAVIVAMYGVSPAYWQDRKSWVDVPDDMRPRRNRTLRLITFSLMMYLILLAGFLLARKFHQDYRKYQAVARISANLEAELDQLSADATPNPVAEELGKQIVEANQASFSFPAALAEFTRLTSAKLWATNLNWDAGELRVELKADNDEPDLTLSLRESPLLTDFTMRKRQLQDQSANYTITCRMKLPDEIASYQSPVSQAKSNPGEKPLTAESTPEPPQPADKENDMDPFNPAFYDHSQPPLNSDPHQIFPPTPPDASSEFNEIPAPDSNEPNPAIEIDPLTPPDK